MSALKIKNWDKFQHYQNKKKGARLAWIKLYHALLDDLEWFNLDPSAAKTLINLWLIGAENNGFLPEVKTIAFRLRQSESEVKASIVKLSHWLYLDSREPLEQVYSTSRQEEEEDKEKEKKKKKTVATKDVAKSESTALSVNLPKNGELTDNSKPPHVLYLDRFKEYYEKKTGHPYKHKNEHFPMVHKLIEAHGIDAVMLKTNFLSVLCEHKSAWFTQGGWADFSVGKLSSMWNSILPEAAEETVQEKEDRVRAEFAEKRRKENELIKSVMDTK